MCDMAAMVIDSEYLNSACRRVTGKNLDPVKFRQYVEQELPGRFLLWTHWCMIDDPGAPEEVLTRRAGFMEFLRRKGFRVIRCPVKPNAAQSGEVDNNACDFYVAESIRLACKVATTVIVATGDGHFRCVTKNVHTQDGRRVEIIGDRSSVSKSLEADRFHFLDQVVKRYDITRDDRGSEGRRSAA